MKTIFAILLLAAFTLASCQSDKNAQSIVNQAIKAHGGQYPPDQQVSFVFRAKEYTVLRNTSGTTYTRSFEDDSLGQIKDVLINSADFTRTINGVEVELTDKKRQAYTNSVNSVLYFFQLPVGLNDAAVIKKHLGQSIINEQLYDKVQVSFGEAQGGEDFEDVFIYWFNAETYTMDFMAYSYKTSGGGMRFRQAINSRIVEGIRVQDYINMKPTKKSIKVEDLDIAFTNGNLIELSRITNEQVKVTPAQ